jgi:hypothetical protein
VEYPDYISGSNGIGSEIKEEGKMKLSINIIKIHLKNYIVMENILPDSKLSLSCYELYDVDICSFQKTCLYVCSSEELVAADQIPEGVSFICCGKPKMFVAETYRHINLLMIEGVSFKKLFNTVLSVFKKYQSLEKCFDHLISRNIPLQQIIDFATTIVETPLCMIDLNHNVLAISSVMDSPEDSLWDAMKDGYGYTHYDIVSKSEPKLTDLVQYPSASVERISNISGHYIKVITLFKGNRAVAFLGMHRVGDTDKPFEEHTKQLFDYIVIKLTKRLKLFSDVKFGRGKLFEQFLLDVIRGKIQSKEEIKRYVQNLGLQRYKKCQLGLISFNESVIRTDYHIAMMDYLEIIIHESKCIMMDSYIVIIFPLNEEDYLPDALQTRLSNFLKTHKCFCILSPEFEELKKLSKIVSQVKTVLPLINKNNERNIYYYYEYAQLHCMKVLSENISLDTLRHPMIKKLINYDLKHNADYLETFKAYLRNNCNISNTSKILHMHRNSLLYRINRIEELLGSTFDNWELRRQLLFSIDYLEYEIMILKK